MRTVRLKEAYEIVKLTGGSIHGTGRVIQMKKIVSAVLVMACGMLSLGCTQIVSIEPKSGSPGTAVYVKSSGLFGDPADQCLMWDGKKICEPFSGSFVIPDADKGGKPGKHTVTLVDNLDATEAFLIFPIFRMRLDSAKITVTE